MTVLLSYFDEVKHQRGRDPSYRLAAIAVEATAVKTIEAQVSSFAKECFGSAALGAHTEFHTSAMINRRDHFAEWDTSRRIATLKGLLAILDQHDVISKIAICLRTDRMLASDVEAKAFMFLTERLDAYLETKKSVGLLIGDRESDRAAEDAATALSGFRSSGTPYQFGRDIKHLIDTVHFTHSHLSRMLQLADLYAWTLQFCGTAHKPGSVQKEMQEFIRTETRILSPHKYKDWPTEDSYLQVGQ